MKSIGLLMAFLCLSSCFSHFKTVKCDQNFAETPDCSGICELIEKEYKVYRKGGCHLSNGFHITLVEKYSDCLKTLSSDQVLSLLGKPDLIREGNFWYYFFDETCEPPSLRHHEHMEIRIIDNKVSSIRKGLRMY